jgi:GT2 family glycosyltransferase
MNEQPQVAVIIVNYNVVFFLEQCLNAVEKALLLEPAEVWVVDNNSVDGSVAMVRSKFP